MVNYNTERRDGARSIAAFRTLLSSHTSVSDDFRTAATAVLDKILSYRQLSLQTYTSLPKSGTMHSFSVVLQDFGKRLSLSNQQAIIMRCLILEMFDCASDALPLRVSAPKPRPSYIVTSTIKSGRRK